MNATQAQRLLNVATALREAPPELAEQFDMTLYAHNCNTPACALGHYAFRRDMQRLLQLGLRGNIFYTKPNTIYGGFDMAGHDSVEVREHFGINYQEAELLFDEDGCDEAKTVEQAAKFIEDFLDKNGWTS